MQSINSQETNLFERILVNEVRKIPTTPRFDPYPLNGVVMRAKNARARASVYKKRLSRADYTFYF